MATRRIKQYQSGAKKNSLPGMANRAAKAGNYISAPMQAAMPIIAAVKKATK